MKFKNLPVNYDMLNSPQWPRWFGYLFFSGMLSAGCYYILKFVQLGLEDFGRRRLALSPPAHRR
jgi:hypothetical protein